MKQIDLAVIGYGGRGSLYAKYARFFGSRIVAVCDPDADRRAASLKDGAGRVFASQDEFFALPKLAGAVIIATMDKEHYAPAVRALEAGYDILLEKPVSPNLNECIAIAEKARKLKRKVVVCHCLRYSPFFTAMKQILDGGKLGDIMDISLVENVGYYHFAHSFVRGNWRNSETSAPVILAKSCHDLDILCWFIGKPCVSVSSFGSLSHFIPANAPGGSADRCCDCKIKDKCVYNCYSIYNNKKYESLAGLAKHGRLGTAEPEINARLSEEGNLYGRCVYRCDNNVCDRQAVNMLFEGGVTAQFTLSAFSEDMGRSVKIHCSGGEIFGNIDKNKVHYTVFGKKTKTVEVSFESGEYASHGGGDILLVKQFIEYAAGGGRAPHITDIGVSVMSHAIAFAAEESRLDGGRVVKL